MSDAFCGQRPKPLVAAAILGGKPLPCTISAGCQSPPSRSSRLLVPTSPAAARGIAGGARPVMGACHSAVTAHGPPDSCSICHRARALIVPQLGTGLICD